VAAPGVVRLMQLQDNRVEARSPLTCRRVRMGTPILK
jgi:hypothetical protein